MLIAVAFSALILVAACNSGGGGGGNSFKFTDVTAQSGFNYTHGFKRPPSSESLIISGGVAAGDYDGDGWVDLYVVRGNIGPNLLFRNMGDGTFQEVGGTAGLDIDNSRGSGPTFADYDGDGWLDLFIGGIGRTDPSLFRNLGDGTFEDVTLASGLIDETNTYSAAFGDYDLDGDLDLFITHWLVLGTPKYLLRNNGDGTFTDVTSEAGLPPFTVATINSFTPNFADINNDGWPDLLIAADFGKSRVFINQQDGTFTDATTPVISDENGMGASVGDYDNDGDLDWFVTSIFDDDGVAEGNWGVTGNRLYRNTGDGTFEDATDEAGVRNGYWGWASCFADFNNDGFLDIFHVNGFPQEDPDFVNDPSVLFISNGDGTFTEMAKELGLDDTGQGRGVVCFDYDRDGDIDIFIANNQQPPRLYRNDGGNSNNFLNIKLIGLPPNTESIGARIFLTLAGETQMRELRAGSNFESQNPVEVNFGLGSATLVEMISIKWLDGATIVLGDVAANQFLEIPHPNLP
ncbi:MAG: CRTAC1 family protein [Candidatus Dadabacteria bacterium]|nr:CRTAC1 family protein [Candidatus Dadabacteria bacterium]